MRIHHSRFATTLFVSMSLAYQAVPTFSGEPTGALSNYGKPRTWSDSTGKHKIQGALSFADSSEVMILQDNGKTMRIKLTGLSSADQAFVRKFLKDEESASGDSGDNSQNPFVDLGDEGNDSSPMSLTQGLSGLGTEEESENGKTTAAAGSSIDTPTMRKASIQNVKRFTGKFDKPFWSVKPIKGFPDPKFEEFGFSSSAAKPFFASASIKTGGTFGVGVVNIHQQGGPGSSQSFSRSFVIFAKDGTSSPIVESKTPWKLMAISPDGKRVAMVRVEGFDKGNDVGIFNVTRNGLVADFQFKAGGGSFDEIHFVGFASGNRLVTISQKHTVGVWDLGNDKIVKAVYVGNSGGALTAEMSPARELMALPAGNGVAIIDIVGAKLAGLLQRPNKPSNISFSPDGKRLAVFEPFELAIYDMVSGELIKSIPVAEFRSNALVGWLGNYVMVGSVVHDVDRGLPLWTYESQDAVQSTLGSFAYSVFPTDKGTNFSLVNLPHQAAIDAAKEVDPAAIYALRPGDEVALEFNLRTTPSDKQSEIRKIVEAKVEKLGWKVSAGASIKVVVEMEAGAQESQEYYTSNSRSPFLPPRFIGPFAPTGPKETVTFTPWTHKFSVYTGDKLEFESINRIGAPNNFSVGEGESTQAVVSRICQPTPSYFEHLAVPPNLLKREFQGGLGKSKLTSNGLE